MYVFGNFEKSFERRGALGATHHTQDRLWWLVLSVTHPGKGLIFQGFNLS